MDEGLKVGLCFWFVNLVVDGEQCVCSKLVVVLGLKVQRGSP